MRTLVVVNPASARGRTGRRWPQVEPLFRKHLGDFQVAMTERSGQAHELVRAALLGGTQRVVSVGGDGSNFEAIQGFFDPASHTPIAPDACFAFVTSGTGSDLARTLQLPKAIDAQLARIAAAEPRVIDLVSCSYAGDTGPEWRAALNAVGFGQSGDLVRRVENWKWLGSGGGPFVAAGIAGAMSVRPWQLDIRLDDGPWEVHALRNLGLFNGRFQGGGMLWAPDARLDDGLLEVVGLSEPNPLRAIAIGIASYRGRAGRSNKVWTARARRVEVRPHHGHPPAWVELDGESPGQIPATYESMPGALRLAM
ncbi:MAG: diacylglycerol kinase family lipid kinase [Deltaproteobacteria bacterium]|nr:diacylglycerol kinase family lipid kinase [Deltaproteobacteria bacterium]